MKKFKDSRELRLANHDYSSEGYYFLTFNTKNKAPFLGKIIKGMMSLNELGCIAAKFWQQIPNYFSNVILDEWIIMPNHIHGIIQLSEFCGATPWSGPTEPNRNKFCQFGDMVPKSISSIINQFKGSVKRWANDNGHSYFFWQSRFYDRIIRSEDELNRIRQYIRNNPMKWELQKEGLAD